MKGKLQGLSYFLSLFLSLHHWKKEKKKNTHICPTNHPQPPLLEAQLLPFLGKGNKDKARGHVDVLLRVGWRLVGGFVVMVGVCQGWLHVASRSAQRSADILWDGAIGMLVVGVSKAWGRETHPIITLDSDSGPQRCFTSSFPLFPWSAVKCRAIFPDLGPLLVFCWVCWKTLDPIQSNS